MEFKILFFVLFIAGINSLPLQDGEVTDGHMQVIKPFEDNDFSAFNEENSKEEEIKNKGEEENFEDLIIDHVGDDPLAGPIKIKEQPSTKNKEETFELPHEEDVEKLTEKEFIEGEHDHEKRESKVENADEKFIPKDREEVHEETPNGEDFISEEEEQDGNKREPTVTSTVNVDPEKEISIEDHTNEEGTPFENLNNEEFTSEEEEEGYGGEAIFTYPVKAESEEETYEEETPVAKEEHSEKEAIIEHKEEEEETKPYSEEVHDEEIPFEEHVTEEEAPIEEHEEEESPIEEETNEEETPIEDETEKTGEETEEPTEETTDDVEWGDPNEEIPPPEFPKILPETQENASQEHHDEEHEEHEEHEE